MSKKTKIWLIIAVSLIIVGSLIFVCTMSSIGWDFTRISTFKFTKNTHTVSETYANIDITTAEASVELAPSQNGETSVVCFEKTTVTHSVSAENGTLIIKFVDKRQWYDHIGFSFTSPKVTVYLPQETYDSVSVKSGTGNVTIPNSFSLKNLDIQTGTGGVTSHAVADSVTVRTGTGNVNVKNCNGAVDIKTSTGYIKLSAVNTTKDVKLSVSTGYVAVSDVVCNNFRTDSITGNIGLSNVLSTNKMTVTATTGNVKLTKCDASEIYIETSTGNVNGTLLTEKNFKATSSTGSVSVPQSVSTAGICEITASTGNIKITISE